MQMCCYKEEGTPFLNDIFMTVYYSFFVPFDRADETDHDRLNGPL